MKISVQQYARGLYDSVVGKTEPEAKAAIKNFVAILGRNRVLNKASEIIAAWQEVWNKEHGELAARLTSARELGGAAKETVINYLKNKTNAQKIVLKEEIDKSLLGGFVLRYGSWVMDGSLKNSLRELKNKINN